MLAYVADPERMARFYEQALGLEGLRGRVEESPAGAAGRGAPGARGGSASGRLDTPNEYSKYRKMYRANEPA
ncbi:VOC family protein, partial [Pseudomonas aeruginosa]|uniref:VOC family protein n=1 Tax=Pseudomonas aeruginosa TaxID=287 RepID=UPI0035A01EAF